MSELWNVFFGELVSAAVKGKLTASLTQPTRNTKEAVVSRNNAVCSTRMHNPYVAVHRYRRLVAPLVCAVPSGVALLMGHPSRCNRPQHTAVYRAVAQTAHVHIKEDVGRTGGRRREGGSCFSVFLCVVRIDNAYLRMAQ